MRSDDSDRMPEKARKTIAARQQIRRFVACGLFLCLAMPAAAQKRPLVPADYYRQVNVGEVAVAPSGALVAFTVTTVVEKENRRHREIWILRQKEDLPASCIISSGTGRRRRTCTTSIPTSCSG